MIIYVVTFETIEPGEEFFAAFSDKQAAIDSMNSHAADMYLCDRLILRESELLHSHVPSLSDIETPEIFSVNGIKEYPV